MTARTIHYDETNKVILSLIAAMEAAGAVLSRTRKVKEDPTLMTKEEFYAKLDRASAEAATSNTPVFQSVNDLWAYIEAL